MKIKQILFIAAAAMATCCLYSCGDDETAEPQKYYKIMDYKVPCLNLDGPSTIQCVSQLENTKGYFVVTQEDAINLNARNVNAIFALIRDTEKNEEVEFGKSLNFEGKEFSSIVANLFMYPHDISFKNGIDITIMDKDQKEQGSFKGLDIISYEYNNDSEKTKGSYNPHLTFKYYYNANSYNLVLNGKLEVVKKDTVTYKAESSNGEIAFKYGVEVNTSNDFVLNAVRNLLGTKILSSVSTQVESSSSVEQEVVTMKLTSGENSYEVKAYGKPF